MPRFRPERERDHRIPSHKHIEVVPVLHTIYVIRIGLSIALSSTRPRELYTFEHEPSHFVSGSSSNSRKECSFSAGHWLESSSIGQFHRKLLNRLRGLSDNDVGNTHELHNDISSSLCSRFLKLFHELM